MRAAFDAYIAPARLRAAWWRVLLGLAIVGFVWFGWGVALIAALSSGWLEFAGLDRDAAYLMGAEGRVMPPDAVFVFLLTFLGLWAGLWVALRLLHRRPFGTLFHPSGRVQGRDFGAGVALALAFHAVSLALYVAVLGAPERTDLPLGAWLPWLIPIVLAVVMQATSEELLFRGYILQQFAVWSRNPVVWAVVPALIFAALHYDGGMEAGMRWRMLVHIAVFGLVTAALVWRTGGLGAAIGLHVANNILAIGVFGIEGAAFGFELWLFGADTLTRMFPVDMALGIAMLGIVLFIFPRKASA